MNNRRLCDSTFRTALLQAFIWIVGTSYFLGLGYIGTLVPAVAQTTFGPPKTEILQSGDLIWPKKPGTIVPYMAPRKATLSDKELWERERDDYIVALRSNPNLTDTELQRIKLLKDMSYDTFLKVFSENISTEAVTPLGEKLGVGHVAIVRIANGRTTIVEAMWGIGVREISYEDWKHEREGQIFWHGRLKGLEPALRAQVAERAFQEIGKPYKFFNFNLADRSGFYCSKLAWLMIRDATNVIADDNPNPDRILWFSPKQLLGSGHFEILLNPGDYRDK